MAPCPWTFRCEQLGLQGVGIERPGEEEALNLVDVLAAEVVDLPGGLDALGEGREAEVLAELDEGADNTVTCAAYVQA